MRQVTLKRNSIRFGSYAHLESAKKPLMTNVQIEAARQAVDP